MIVRVTPDHHFYVQSENTVESKFLGWRLDADKRAKDGSYTIDSQDFMTLMRKFTKAKIAEDGDPGPQG
jgi:hypothetical protein